MIMRLSPASAKELLEFIECSSHMRTEPFEMARLLFRLIREGVDVDQSVRRKATVAFLRLESQLEVLLEGALSVQERRVLLDRLDRLQALIQEVNV